MTADSETIPGLRFLGKKRGPATLGVALDLLEPRFWPVRLVSHSPRLLTILS
jgi:hypothetical protein